MISFLRRIGLLRRRLRADQRGNVLMIFALSVIPLAFATGMTIDYARAARTQTRLNTVLDASALSGVTPDMLSKTRLESIRKAGQMFYGQAGMTQCQGSANRVFFNPCAEAYSDNGSVATYTDGTLTLVATDTSTVGLSRTIKASYSANSGNIFGNLLGSAMIPIGGTSTTNAKIAPNVDFYVLLDTSGSMAFPSTSSGITMLRSKTGGCAFACHSTNDKTAYNASNKLTDYYGVATSFNITLRVDEAKTAVANMMALANSTAASNNADYRAALMSFAAADTRTNNSFKTRQTLTTNLSSVGSAAAAASTSLYDHNTCPTTTFCNNNTDTASSDAFTRMNGLIPNPGNGTDVANDKPQAIMFVVTDGMRDENRPGSRPEVDFELAKCDALKSRGIRIAILYTEFLQSSMDGDSWSQSNVVPYLYKVEPALKSCASPGLMYKVTTDDDISTALSRLFQAAIANAHITQ